VAPAANVTLVAANTLGCALFRLARARYAPSARRAVRGSLRPSIPRDVHLLLVDAMRALLYVLEHRQAAGPRLTGEACLNAGAICSQRGKYNRAVPFLEEAVRLLCSVHPADHPDCVNATRDLKQARERQETTSALWIATYWRAYVTRRAFRVLIRARRRCVLLQRVGRALIARRAVAEQHNQNRHIIVAAVGGETK
jgi:hypothetical protein